jgi:hypothetical protein
VADRVDEDRLVVKSPLEQVKSSLHIAEQRDREVEDDAKRRYADDRSWIAKRIMLIFTAVVGLVILLNIMRGIWTGQWDKATDASGELLKTTMLPIVTLVLGYYFGQSSK